MPIDTISGEIPARRRIERRELITLFNAMPPGGSITTDELNAQIGLDIHHSGGDRSLVYNVREHCTQVLGFVITFKDGVYTRLTDAEVVGITLPSRRERILRQTKRGLAESEAISNFAALTRPEQIKLLSHQSIFGAIALASHREAPSRVGEALATEGKLREFDPQAVIAVIGSIRQ